MGKGSPPRRRAGQPAGHQRGRVSAGQAPMCPRDTRQPSCFTATRQGVLYPGHPLGAPEGSDPPSLPQASTHPGVRPRQEEGPSLPRPSCRPGVVSCLGPHPLAAGPPGGPRASCSGRGKERGPRPPVSSACFPGYLSKLLQNHTAYACDGDHLTLRCPRHSTISVQSAFYGRDDRACRAPQPAGQGEDSLTCEAPTTLQVLRF